MLEADLTVQRRDLTVELCLEVGGGERVALFGPSGAGKTTVLEAIAGLVPLGAGAVALNGAELSRAPGAGRRRALARLLGARSSGITPVWARQVALVRQEPALFPHMSVEGNLCYAKRARRDQLERVVDALEIGGLMGAMPAALSGGQAQRVALGRALLFDYGALLLDEPFAGLEARLRSSLTAFVRDEVRLWGAPGVLVAHDLADAQAFADRLGVIDGGRLLQFGAPDEVVRRPASRRVAELVGYRSFVPSPEGGGAVTAVHPDKVVAGAVASLGPVLQGTVASVRPAGARFEVGLEVRGVLVTCNLPVPPEGETVVVTLDHPPSFGPDGRAR